jgi:hypothetical protein
MRLIPLLTATAVSVAMMVGAASADLDPAVYNAFILMTKVPSYHMTLAMPGSTAESDVSNPGKVHTVMPEGEAVQIGTTLYMKIDGKWTKNTVSASENPAVTYLKARANISTQDIGMRPVSGVLLHAYSVHNLKRPSDKDTVYLDSSGRIARWEIDSAVMTFSRYGEPVMIRAPI